MPRLAALAHGFVRHARRRRPSDGTRRTGRRDLAPAAAPPAPAGCRSASRPYHSGRRRTSRSARRSAISTSPSATCSDRSCVSARERRQLGHEQRPEEEVAQGRQPPDAGQRQIRDRDVRRDPLQPVDAGLDPREHLVGSAAVEDVVADVGHQRPRLARAARCERPPQPAIEDARQAPEQKPAAVAVAAAVSESGQHARVGAPGVPRELDERVQAAGEIAGAEGDDTHLGIIAQRGRGRSVLRKTMNTHRFILIDDKGRPPYIVPHDLDVRRASSRSSCCYWRSTWGCSTARPT